VRGRSIIIYSWRGMGSGICDSLWQGRGGGSGGLCVRNKKY